MESWTTGEAPNPLLRRTPPNNKDAERNVLAACFDRYKGLDELETPLAPKDFYSPWLSAVWGSMASLRERRIPVDALAVANDMERQGSALSDDQKTDLVVLEVDTVPTAAQVNYYAKIVMALSRKRQLIEAGARIVELGWSNGKVADTFDKAHELLFAVTADRASQKIYSGDVLAKELLDHVNDPNRDPGVVSGWRDLDEVVQCFRPREMSILAARPSMGKTSLALCLAAAMLNRNERVGIASLEMDRLQLACNATGSFGGVDTTKIRRGVFGETEPGRFDSETAKQEYGRTVDGIMWLEQTGERLGVFDGVVASVRDLGRVLERMVQRHQCRIVFVDYMQLLSGTENTRGGGRYAEITEVSIMLKRYARQLNIHLCVLAQLNRKVEDRSDKKPIMADLRDSGQVEQDADVIMLLHRPEYYFPDKPELNELALLNVAKNRNGPTGMVRLRFEKTFTRFTPA
jgi:replicative DNA helicase